MRLVIAGSRSIAPPVAYAIITQAMAMFDLSPTTVVSGTARGVDAAGERWAQEAGVSVQRYPADWDRYGKAAGPIRNRLMAENADALLLIWDGKSRGSANMKQTAEQLGLPVYEIVYSQ